MKTIAEIITLSTEFLTQHHIEHARRFSEELLAFILKMKRLDLYLQYDRPLIDPEILAMREYLKRCAAGEPVPYILGKVDFYGCQIAVSPDVLIPRPETEILVDLVKKRIGLDKKILWDLCTGSGCVGLGLKRSCPNLTVVLSDISEKALAMARRNKELNQLDVECRLGDLLIPFTNEKADIVICNPPYISNFDYQKLDRSVRDFEPSIALLAGEKGVDFYERLSRELPSHLNPKARVFLEIGYDQGPAVQEIFNRAPWGHFELLKDWSGHDRFFFLEIE